MVAELSMQLPQQGHGASASAHTRAHPLRENCQPHTCPKLAASGNMRRKDVSLSPLLTRAFLADMSNNPAKCLCEFVVLLSMVIHAGSRNRMHSQRRAGRGGGHSWAASPSTTPRLGPAPGPSTPCSSPRNGCTPWRDRLCARPPTVYTVTPPTDCASVFGFRVLYQRCYGSGHHCE